MMARIAHGVPYPVPYWQLITSMLLLIAGFLGTAWVAAKSIAPVSFSTAKSYLERNVEMGL